MGWFEMLAFWFCAGEECSHGDGEERGYLVRAGGLKGGRGW